MKKALPALLVLVVVAAAVTFFLNRNPKSGLDLAPGRAAALAPADALFYMEMPDIERSTKRWDATALHAIAQEPEWKEFLGKWDEFKAQNEIAKSAFGVIADVQKADPAGLFFAVTKVDGPFPKMVGGLPYRGKKSDVEGVIRQLRDELLKLYPAAKREITKLGDTEVETLTDPSFMVAMAFRDNWFFFGTDLPLLEQTLARYAGKADAPAGLAKDPLYADTLKHGSAEPDFVLWGRWSAIMGQINALSGLLGAPSAPTADDPNPTEAFLYTAKMDGALMREQLYMHMKEGPKASAFPNRSLAFTQAATYAYVMGDYSGLEEQMKGALKAMELLGATGEIEKQLQPKGLKVADIFTTFGPEIAMMSAWEGGAVFPDFFAAVELRDAAKGRLFAELIAEEMGKGDNLLKSELEGTTYWALKDMALGPVEPTLAVNDKHLMFGLNGSVIKTALTQLKTNAANIVSHPGSPYPAALKTVLPPTGGLVYLDAKFLFEKLYDKAKPFVAMSLVGDPEIAKHFDAGKLPSAETISKHLSPIIVSVGASERGWKIESTGTVSFMGAYSVIIPVGLFGTMRMTAPAPAPVAPAPAQAAPIDDSAPVPAPGGNPP